MMILLWKWAIVVYESEESHDTHRHVKANNNVGGFIRRTILAISGYIIKKYP